jgi:hypothetical protein
MYDVYMRRDILSALLFLLGVNLISQEFYQINGQGAYSFQNIVLRDGKIIKATLVVDSRFEIPIFTPQGQSFISIHLQGGTEVSFTYITPPLLGDKMLIGYPTRGTLARDLILTLEGMMARGVFKAGTEIEFQYRYWERGSLRYEYAVIREGVLRNPIHVRTDTGERVLVANSPHRFVLVRETPLPVLALE